MCALCDAFAASTFKLNEIMFYMWLGVHV